MIFTKHALLRCAERGISQAMVLQAIAVCSGQPARDGATRYEVDTWSAYRAEQIGLSAWWVVGVCVIVRDTLVLTVFWADED